MHTSERHIHDRLGSALYRLATIEQRANDTTESPRAVGKLLGEVRKLTAELQRSFAELQDLIARSTTSQRAAATAIARANLLFELSPVACLILEPVGAVEDANQAAARFLNVSHRHLVGKSFPLFLARDRDDFVHRIQGMRADDAAARWAVTLRPRERSAVECVLVAALDPEGRVLVMLIPGATVETMQTEDAPLDEAASTE